MIIAKLVELFQPIKQTRTPPWRELYLRQLGGVQSGYHCGFSPWSISDEITVWHGLSGERSVALGRHLLLAVVVTMLISTSVSIGFEIASYIVFAASPN